MFSLQQLDQYKKELQNELSELLNFWQKNTIDNEFGGFYGKLDNSNKVFPHAPKGSVLNSRILWTFSAAYNPVSYTHLRAHETRHDLVCRLLLEKKKKKKT